jgi:hypothetical protein
MSYERATLVRMELLQPLMISCVVFSRNSVVIGKGRIQGEEDIVDGQIPVTHATNSTLTT